MYFSLDYVCMLHNIHVYAVNSISAAHVTTYSCSQNNSSSVKSKKCVVAQKKIPIKISLHNHDSRLNGKIIEFNLIPSVSTDYTFNWRTFFYYKAEALNMYVLLSGTWFNHFAFFSWVCAQYFVIHSTISCFDSLCASSLGCCTLSAFNHLQFNINRRQEIQLYTIICMSERTEYTHTQP